MARRTCALIAAIGVSLVFGGARAHASCGHYVKRLGPGFVPGRSVSTTTESAEAMVPVDSDSPPSGCNGPECHGKPTLPVPSPAPAPQRTPSHRDLATIADSELHLPCPSAMLCDGLSDRPLNGYPQRLNRPPTV